ncbi:MAG: acyl transferase, partial [Cyclobacteriaceae bacterium]|nr:acyl transferase [Cyclobacteriaceae bacterium]
MDFSERFKSDLINLTPSGFESFALDLFSFQFQHNRVYNTYCSIRGKSPLNVTNLTDIPFLPIELYKNHTIKTGDWKEEKWFLSSGTTGSQRSKLPIRDLHFYETISKHIFENKYGKLQNIQILGLLPSYQEQGHSSLIHMVDSFMKNARNGSGYFLDGSQALIDRLESPDGKKLLVGVSYALLDFTEDKNCLPVDTFVMETGGMKGRRKEMVREELHLQLTQALGVPSIHSEYGMTELTSQAYASQEG